MAESSAVEYADVSLLDCVRRRRNMYNDQTGEVTEQDRRDEIPEELMSELETYVGDGNAKITVSAELSSSHEYHGAKAFVSISVTCNNNLEDVAAVHNIVRPRVQELAHKDHEEMSLLRDSVLPPGKQKHTEPSGLPTGEKLARPPAKKAGSKTKAAAPTTKRSAKTVTKKPGVKKPNFRR